jgi:hypothetical protein
MSWVLPTATGRYVVDLAPAEAGPVLQDWTDGDIRDWSPSSLPGFETALDRLPSELSALGSRQVRGADLIVDHGNGLLGARRLAGERRRGGHRGTFHPTDRTRHDTTGDLGLRWRSKPAPAMTWWSSR